MPFQIRHTFPLGHKGFRTKESYNNMDKSYNSDEYKNKMKEIALSKGYGLWLNGKKLSESHKRNIGEGLKNHIVSKESRIKMSIASKGKKKSEEARRNMSIAALRNARLPGYRNGNKFHVSPANQRTYNGIVYDSKKEMEYAVYLDLLLKTKKIVKWERQFPFLVEINEKKICRYYCDFKVYYPDKRIEFHEVKGYKTDVYLIKKALVEALFGVTILEK